MRLTENIAEKDLLPGGYIVSVVRRDTLSTVSTFASGHIYTTKTDIANKVKSLIREIEEYKARSGSDIPKEYVIVVSEIKYQAGSIVVMTATDPPQEKLE